jgi:hypothetical protein
VAALRLPTPTKIPNGGCRISPPSTRTERPRGSKLGEAGLHTWADTGSSANPLGAHWLGIVFGLGFVLSFGYWTTNFAEVQRALSARNMSAARRTPIIGAYPKLLIPLVTVIPGPTVAGYRPAGRRRATVTGQPTNLRPPRRREAYPPFSRRLTSSATRRFSSANSSSV